MSMPTGVQITAPLAPGYDRILSVDALALVAALHRSFEARRQELLASARRARAPARRRRAP